MKRVGRPSKKSLNSKNYEFISLPLKPVAGLMPGIIKKRNNSNEMYANLPLKNPELAKQIVEAISQNLNATSLPVARILIEIFYLKYNHKKIFEKHLRNLKNLSDKTKLILNENVDEELKLFAELYVSEKFSPFRDYFIPGLSMRLSPEQQKHYFMRRQIFYNLMFKCFRYCEKFLVEELRSSNIRTAIEFFNVSFAYLRFQHSLKSFKNAREAKRVIKNILKNRNQKNQLKISSEFNALLK